MPKNLRDLRRFTGLISWYRRFVPNVASLAAPLNNLLCKNVRWTWGETQEKAFNTLKEHLIKAPILACPNFSETFILQTDASNDGLGAVLTQNIDGKERVIAYASRTLNKAEKNYSATEKECLAVKWGIWKLRDYLEGYHFVVITDHQSLRWLSKIDNPSDRLARWAIELNQWDFEVKYRKSTENTVADALSRSPLEICAVDDFDNWYSATFEKTEKSPDENPEYCISDGKLYKH
uniref:Reverse transcriptase RNase H-like domain-containing protein n=1 Tax=Trichogramma kaykai TaxID=54128 RepID=A0ABD2W2E3_9HYME